MSKLLKKYEEFLSELDKVKAPLEEVLEKEDFTKEECHHIANFCAGAITIQKDIEHYKEAIEAVEQTVEYFNLEEGK